MVFFVLLIGYFIFILFLVHGFRKQPQVNQEVSVPSTTVLVPFRNEEQEIEETAKALIRAVTHMPEIREIIWINDHSTDQSRSLLLECLNSSGFNRGQVIDAMDEGKKNALRLGIEKAESEVILTVDADVYPEQGWPISVLSPFMDSKIQMVCGPVHIERKENSIANLFESIDVLSMVGSANALISNGWAVMCNGANMAFRKLAFTEVKGYQGNLQLKSGDDVFLLHKVMKRYPHGVVTPKNFSGSGVTSLAQSTWRDLFHQRLRWAGKSKHYKTAEALFTSIFIAAICAAIVLGTLLSFFYTAFLLPSLVLLLGKALIDTVLLTYFSKAYARKLPVGFIFLQGIVYPYYTLLIALVAPFYRVKWKGR